MAKKNIVLVKLVSSEGSGYFYVRGKNPKKTTAKLKFRKYDPKLRKHVEFDEKKLSS
jgi:large subunit ribosomal protein L33